MQKFNSICLLRLSAIGDVCHAVATIQAIQKEYDRASITWIIGKIEYSLVQHIPNINFIIFDKKKGVRAYLEIFHLLRKQQFDVLLHMQVAIRASIITLMIKAPIKIGFDKARAKELQWLFTNQTIAPLQKNAPHVLDGFMQFATKIGVKDITPTWSIPIPQTTQDTVTSKLTLLKTPFFIISPAASKESRNWLSTSYAQIADYMHMKGFTTIICGGSNPKEIELGEQICLLCKTKPINLIGQTTLLELLAILKQASLVLAPDTGPLHMAVTQNIPVVGLYAHSDPRRTGPYSKNTSCVSVYNQIMNKKTSNPSWGQRNKGDDLMQLISVDMVKDKLDLILKTKFDKLSF